MNPNKSIVDVGITGGGGCVMTSVIFNYMQRRSNLVGRSGQFGGVERRRAPRLNTMKGNQRGRMAEGLV